MKLAISSFLFVLVLMSSCKTKDLSKVDPAKCIDSTKVDMTIQCERKFEPVCGCDGKTYPNKCYADRAGVQHYVKGQCKDLKTEEN